MCSKSAVELKSDLSLDLVHWYIARGRSDFNKTSKFGEGGFDVFRREERRTEFNKRDVCRGCYAGEKDGELEKGEG